MRLARPVCVHPVWPGLNLNRATDKTWRLSSDSTTTSRLVYGVVARRKVERGQFGCRKIVDNLFSGEKIVVQKSNIWSWKPLFLRKIVSRIEILSADNFLCRTFNCSVHRKIASFCSAYFANPRRHIWISCRNLLMSNLDNCDWVIDWLTPLVVKQ